MEKNEIFQKLYEFEGFSFDKIYKETLAYAKTPEQRERLVEIENHDVRRLDRLITDISDASRLDAELARGEAQAFDMSQLLESITNYANDTRKDGQAEVEFEIAKPPPGMDRAKAYTVMGHDSRLGQVVRNLIDNARSFTRPGTKLSVRVRRVGPDVEFRVDDSGPGIPPDNLQRVFERFKHVLVHFVRDKYVLDASTGFTQT